MCSKSDEHFATLTFLRNHTQITVTNAKQSYFQSNLKKTKIRVCGIIWNSRGYLQKGIHLPKPVHCITLKIGQNVKPLSHQTALPQRLYSVLKPCQRAVGSPRNTPKTSNLPVVACTQRLHSVPTASTQRSHGVFTASITFSQRASSCCSVFTARTRRAHGAHTTFSRRATASSRRL